ncbi:ABC-three component system protein [Alloscardovia omnicolens]|uniref:ABC-three component system protein n=1 Tax=Alloscardovia omnicolens TaxID=419015 RepID=UPI003757A994
MLFVDLIHAIHPYLMKDDNVPEFMRNLIQQICSIPEDDWYTKRDPSSEEKYKDGSLRKFYTNGITKKLAKSILGSLTRENFIDFINYHDYVTDVNEIKRDSLAEAISPFTNAQVDANNVADVLFDLLKLSLEYIVNPDLEQDRLIKEAETLSQTAKAKFGLELLEDCSHSCSNIDCNHHLQTVAPDNTCASNYETICLSGNTLKYDNLLAVCHDCFQQYALKHTKKETDQLKKIKKLQLKSNLARKTLNQNSIEKGIRNVIKKITTVDRKDMVTLSYEPVEVAKKINPDTEVFLYDEVKDRVVRYYGTVDKSLRESAKKQEFNDSLFREQLKATYKKLAAKTIDKRTIYQSLAEWLSKMTKQNVIYCYVVICYFIQSCEVFDATTK